MVVETQLMALLTHGFDEVAEFLLIGLTQAGRLKELFARRLHSAKHGRPVEWKVFFRRVDDLKHADIMIAETKVLQSPQNGIGFVEQIGQDDHKSSTTCAIGEVVQDGSDRRFTRQRLPRLSI